MLRLMALRFTLTRLCLIIPFALAVCASETKAWEPYPRLPLNLVVVPGPDKLTQREAKAVFREAHKKYADIGINLSLVKTRARSFSLDRGYREGDEEVWDDRYWHLMDGWKRYFKTRAVKRAVNVALIPRLIDPEGPKMGGMASGICDLHRGVAWGAVSVKDDRLKRSAAIILAHEIGHLAGASHTELWDISIMNPGPTLWIDLGLELDFDLESATSIRRCLRTRGYYPKSSQSQALTLSCKM